MRSSSLITLVAFLLVCNSATLNAYKNGIRSSSNKLRQHDVNHKSRPSNEPEDIFLDLNAAAQEPREIPTNEIIKNIQQLSEPTVQEFKPRVLLAKNWGKATCGFADAAKKEKNNPCCHGAYDNAVIEEKRSGQFKPSMLDIGDL